MVDDEEQEEAQEIAMLTRKLSACSARSMVDRDGQHDQKFRRCLRKGNGE
jgi:hypothetical protein